MSDDLNLEKIKAETEQSLSRNKRILSALFILGIFAFICFIYFAPEFTSAEKQIIFKFPRSAQQIYELSKVILGYTQNSYYYVISLFCFLYVFLQSFAIPGPLILSILGGALFGFWKAMLVVTTCATLGATLCYILSETLGKGIIIRKFPGPLMKANNLINEHKHHLFFYLLFLRVTPIVPNWLINISSPILGISLKYFITATFLGLIPGNCIHINAGTMISSMQEVGLNLNSILILLVLGVLALIPTLIFKKPKVN
ncbi:unnamed protein product [Blepharisma stoltei]|uniref:VTT domain-containing protein n=1 Tax=Blepharisma stoltei TaxID=1481888 RepID=A0AAU9JYD2_9CILI|nr:unnamed protein product [Blepharisma stoltei]